MNISGIVSFTLLKNTKCNKLILLLGDIHDGVEYCQKEHIFIDELLDNFVKNKQFSVLLEEVPRENLQLVELWPNAEHTQRLKEWYLRNQKVVIPIDIRPFLVPFSYQKKSLGLLSKEEENLKMSEYLVTIDSLFELNGRPLNKSVIFFKNIIEYLNKKSERGILSMYKILREKYRKLKEGINMDDTFIETFEKNKTFFKELDDMKINIMDWYTTLLLLSNNNSVVHFGLAHYLNVREILLNNFGFIIIQEHFNKLNKKLDSCLIIK